MSTGYLHQALTAAVLAALPASVHRQVSSWMEPASLSLAGKCDGNGVVLAYLKYTSAIHMEDIPFALVDTASLFAQVAAWLAENDEGRDGLNAAEEQILIDTDRVDDSRIDIDIDVVFNEPLTLVPNPAGTVQFDGQRWMLATPVSHVAEHIDVVMGGLHD